MVHVSMDAISLVWLTLDSPYPARVSHAKLAWPGAALCSRPSNQSKLELKYEACKSQAYPKNEAPYANPNICVSIKSTTKMADSMKRMKPSLLQVRENNVI